MIEYTLDCWINVINYLSYLVIIFYTDWSAGDDRKL